MRRFQYSLQARMDQGSAAFHNIGVMVWSDDTLDYFAVRGEEAHARMMTERIADRRQAGGTIAEFVEYYLERHGGYFYSMARPETVEADSPQDVVRQAGERWDLDFVIPSPPVPKVDKTVVRELLAATEGGAHLDIKGGSLDESDHALVLGFGALGDTVVMGYLPFPYDFSPFSRSRFYVDSVEPTLEGWTVRGRDAWKWGQGRLVIEVRPVVNPVLLTAIERFKEELDEVQREVIDRRLRDLMDPRVL